MISCSNNERSCHTEDVESLMRAQQIHVEEVLKAHLVVHFLVVLVLVRLACLDSEVGRVRSGQGTHIRVERTEQIQVLLRRDDERASHRVSYHNKTLQTHPHVVPAAAIVLFNALHYTNYKP